MRKTFSYVIIKRTLAIWTFSKLKYSSAFYCKLRKPRTLEKFQECWLCRDQSQLSSGHASKHSRPQTNYHCCLRWSQFLAPHWLSPLNTITFHKYFWCSRFCEFDSKKSVFVGEGQVKFKIKGIWSNSYFLFCFVLLLLLTCCFFANILLNIRTGLQILSLSLPISISYVAAQSGKGIAIMDCYCVAKKSGVGK